MTNDRVIEQDSFRVVTSRRRKNRGASHLQKPINVEINLGNSNIDENSIKK